MSKKLIEISTFLYFFFKLFTIFSFFAIIYLEVLYMKKISIAIILFIVIIISCGYNALAYSTIEYSIDIPSNYNKVSENSFTDETNSGSSVKIPAS